MELVETAELTEAAEPSNWAKLAGLAEPVSPAEPAPQAEPAAPAKLEELAELAQPALRWAANLYVELSNLFNFTGRRFPTECPPSRRNAHQSVGIRTTPTAYAPSRRKLHHPDGIRSTFGIKARRNSDQYKVTFGVVAVGSSGQQVCKKSSHIGIMATAKATAPRKTMG